MKCEHERCTRIATTKNQEYHPDKWLCTYHANKKKVEGRIKRKMYNNYEGGKDTKERREDQPNVKVGYKFGRK